MWHHNVADSSHGQQGVNKHKDFYKMSLRHIWHHKNATRHIWPYIPFPWCHWRYCDITDDIMTSYSDNMTSYANVMTSYVFVCSGSWIWTRWTRKQYWVWWGHGTCVVPAYARGRLGLTWVKLVKWFCWSKFGLHVSGFIAVKLWVLFCLESFCQKAAMLSFCGPGFFNLPDFLISSPIFWIFGCWKMWGPPI